MGQKDAFSFASLKSHKNRSHSWILCCLLAGSLAACGSNDGDKDSSPRGDGDGDGNGAIVERDGIPSDDFADLLHYYVSTQEDGPGLYAYRPAEPEAAPVYIDPNVTMNAVFSSTFPIAAEEGGSNLHLRPQGLLYSAADSFPAELGEVASVKTYLVTTDVSQLDSSPQQISSHESPLSFAGISSYSTHGDTLESSSIWLSAGNMRIDLDMGTEDAPLVLPEDGKMLGTLLGEGARTHDHWLYIDADGSLKFYNEDFSASTAVLDEDSGVAIEGLEVAGGFISHLGVEHMLVLLSDPDDEGVGTLYRVSRPEGASEGMAKQLQNAEGETIEFALPGALIGRTIPGEDRRWVDGEAFYFVEGASVFDSATPSRVSRVTADAWSAVEVEGDVAAAFTPNLFIRVDGGFFWAPSYRPELIYPTSEDPSSWTRTPLMDVPQANESTIVSSAADWVYYQSSDDEAVALNVKTREIVSFPDALWVGASFSSNVGEDIRTDLLAHQELSTVLVHLGDNRLGALEAADPQAGVVILGELPETTEAVQVNGPAMGPARLVRVEHEDGGVEIIAVDTRQSGSLRHLMPSPAVQWSYESSLGSTSIELDVEPTATAPLKLF